MNKKDYEPRSYNTNHSFYLPFLQGEGHNLSSLGASMYEEDVTGRVLQIASVLEGLHLIERKLFRVQTFEHITYAYIGPNIAEQLQTQEFHLNRKRYDLRRLRIPLKKIRVDSVLFLPFLQRQTVVNDRSKPK